MSVPRHFHSSARSVIGLIAGFALAIFCDGASALRASPDEGREFLFMGDNTTTYLFRGRELQRREGRDPVPALDSLRPLPSQPITDPASLLPSSLLDTTNKQIVSLANDANVRAFLIISNADEFEDIAWNLLDTLRFGSNDGNELILVFEAASQRVTVLFGPTLLTKYGRGELTQLSKEAAPSNDVKQLHARVTTHVSNLFRRLKSSAEMTKGAESPKKLLFAGEAQTPQTEASGSSSAGSPNTVATPEGAPGKIGQATPNRRDDGAWRTISLVLICVLIPTLIIGAAIAISGVAKRGKQQERQTVPPIDMKPLSTGTGFPERRVKNRDADPVEPLPREPHDDRQRQPDFSAHESPALDAAYGKPFRAKTPRREIQDVTFAEGEQSKINELLTSLRLLQDADTETTVELLGLVRTLLAELKEIAISAETSSMGIQEI
jgi:hypothetical protein